MSKHRATGPRADPRGRTRYGVRRRSAFRSRLLAGLGALAALVSGLGYLISAQPGKAPGARLIEQSSGAATQPATASAPATGTGATGTGATGSAANESAAGGSAAAGSATGSAATAGPLAAAVHQPDSRPVRIQVPAIGVDSGLQPLGLLPDGSLQSPSQRQQAGWYAGGAVPGAVGSAVIAGQVASATAVFHRLSELRPGAAVLISRQDGRVLRFLVYDVRAYPKRGFPSASVYGPVPTPVLRLITSTGGFDEQAQADQGSLVVSANLASG